MAVGRKISEAISSSRMSKQLGRLPSAGDEPFWPLFRVSIGEEGDNARAADATPVPLPLPLETSITEGMVDEFLEPSW